jgi:hypothetical protein
VSVSLLKQKKKLNIFRQEIQKMAPRRSTKQPKKEKVDKTKTKESFRLYISKVEIIKINK